MGSDWGALEGTGLGLVLKPASESAGQHINQTILGPWRRQRHSSNDKMVCPFGWAASIWTGSGARCQVCHDSFINISITLPQVFA